MLVLLLVPAYAQQLNINRVIVFTGYSYLTTPLIGLNQNGFDTSFGINANRWLGLGTDFSFFKGSTNLHFPDTTLGTTLAPVVPAAMMPLLSTLSAPISATTFTWGVGPKVNVRKWSKLTLFAHPGLGLMHESVDVNLTTLLANPVTASIVPLTPLKAHLTDTVPFFGAGVGFDINASRRVGVRFTVDWVRSHMFNNLLDWQNNVRFSVGPTWGFGEVYPAKK
jgi:hypothetical protein